MAWVLELALVHMQVPGKVMAMAAAIMMVAAIQCEYDACRVSEERLYMHPLGHHMNIICIEPNQHKTASTTPLCDPVGVIWELIQNNMQTIWNPMGAQSTHYKNLCTYKIIHNACCL